MMLRRLFGLGCAAMVVMGCAGIHKQQVAQMRDNGDPRADCYDRCGPSGVMCMKQCDNSHPFAGTLLQSRPGGGAAGSSTPEGEPGVAPQQPPIDQAATLQLLTEAAKVDAAKRREREASGSSSMPSSPPSSPPAREPSSIRTTKTVTSTPRSDTDCAQPCAPGQKCLVFFEGTKQCTAGPRCWIVEKTHGECR
jgi:hypothetical protein